MGDVFKEQIVKRKSTNVQALKRVGLAVGVIVVFFAAVIILGPQWMQFILLGTVGATIGAMYLSGRMKVEYEYVFTNGELDIDIIYNRSRRKRIFTGHVNNFEVMAHVEDMNHAGAFQGAQETKDYSSGVVGENTYAFLANYNSKRMKIVFEPNEKVLDAIKGAIPRSKLHLKK